MQEKKERYENNLEEFNWFCKERVHFNLDNNLDWLDLYIVKYEKTNNIRNLKLLIKQLEKNAIESMKAAKKLKNQIAIE